MKTNQKLPADLDNLIAGLWIENINLKLVVKQARSIINEAFAYVPSGDLDDRMSEFLASQQVEQCISDTGSCGVGGYCAECPSKKPEQAEGAQREREALPYWEPCNPGCDPEFNGERSRYCAQLCHNARAVLAQPSPTAVPDGLPPLPWSLSKHNQSSPTYSSVLGGKPSFKPVYLEPMHLLIAQDELGWPLADFILAAVNSMVAKPSPAQELVHCACGDAFQVNSYGAGFMDANNGVCQNCDAATVVQAGQVPEVSGIARAYDHPRAIVLYLRKEPTDDDMRAIQEGLRMLTKQSSNPAPEPVTCPRCQGDGTIWTGIDESPSTICNRCDGTGSLAAAPAQGD